MRRLFLAAMLAAVLAVVALPMIAAAHPVKQRGGFYSVCERGISPWQRDDAADVVVAVEAEYQVNAPGDASSALVNSIQDFYRHGQGCALDRFVLSRLDDPAAEDWYRDVVALNT